MTIPSLMKWRPRCMFYRDRLGGGWQWVFYQHADHNPVIVIERWKGQWYFECYGWRSRQSQVGD